MYRRAVKRQEIQTDAAKKMIVPFFPSVNQPGLNVAEKVAFLLLKHWAFREEEETTLTGVRR
jgi:hypothetical protein